MELRQLLRLVQAVSSKLDDLIQAEPVERQSHLGETEYDPDHREPASKSSKSSPAASKHDKSARSTAGRKSADQQQPDKDAPKGDSTKSGDGNHQVEQEGVTDTAQESGASRRGLSPAGLAWPKRPPRGK